MKVGSRQWVARQGLRLSHELRQQVGGAAPEPVNAIDVAIELGISVRLLPFPTMEGIYLNGSPPSIVLSTLRPKGRIQFTCAHELGHFFLGHGEKFEEIVGTDQVNAVASLDESLADAFAGYLLMPPSLVRRALSQRGILYFETGLDALRVAQWLGVGYSTLLTHMNVGLQMLPKVIAQRLLRHRPTDLCSSLLGYNAPSDVILVDRNWVNRPIDVSVGDFILLEFGDIAVENGLMTHLESPRSGTTTLLVAQRPGLDRLEARRNAWSSYVRIQPERFSGLARFRHLQDSEDAD